MLTECQDQGCRFGCYAQLVVVVPSGSVDDDDDDMGVACAGYPTPCESYGTEQDCTSDWSCSWVLVR